MRLTETIKYYIHRILPRRVNDALNKLRTRKLRNRSPKEIFTDYFHKNKWGGIDSVSGPGSDNSQTVIVKQAISQILKEYRISTILDIPCGDFNWMKQVDFGDATYIGADIVPELIKNNSMYANDKTKFQVIDLINESLPKSDLVIVRDCFIHFSNGDVLKSLRNIINSGSTYLLTTTFTDRSFNGDILTGQWRAINLQIKPFSFGNPRMIINEGCTEEDGKYSDKSLSLWKISEISLS